ncbi:MAG: cytochrome c biogenesis protein CcdA [Geitlerinemataceae cyanobacterium]|mgnify:CR=1 FL=1
MTATWWEALQTWIYDLSQWANGLVGEQLAHLSPLSFGIVLGAGLLTSLTPCMLSMLPIAVGYISGYESESRTGAFVQSLWFAFGLATTLAGLGIVAALFGRVYGQIGIGLPIAVSAIAILMGLNLLEIVPLQLPNLGGTDWISEGWPHSLRSYLLGLTFGLVASPCSTPVLATLLAWITTTGDPVLGSGLLLAYAIGYVLPLVVAGSFAAAIEQFLALRQWSGWITPMSGALLIGFGVFSLVSRLSPAI